MKNSRFIYTSALLISVIASLGLASVRVLALLIEFDPQVSYYSHNAVLPSAFSWGAVIAALIALLFSVLLRGELDELQVDPDSSVVIFFSALAGFILIGGALYGLFTGVLAEGALAIIALILSIPAAVYFLLAIALPVQTKNAQIILSASLILWFFFMIVKTYFAGGVEINNPNRSLLLITLAVTAVYFISESRFRLGTEVRPLYLFCGLVSILMLGLYTLPNIVLIILGAYPDKNDIVTDLIMLTFYLYVLVRMCVASGMIGEDEYEEVEDYEGEENPDKY